MEAGSPVVRKFFEEYERSRNTFDQSLIDRQSPDAVMFAGPSGARVAEKPAVLAGISKGQELFRSLGHRRTTLVSLGGEVLPGKDLEKVASLPTKDQARAQLLGLLVSPAQQLAAVIAAPATDLARVIAAFADKRKGEAGAPA